MVTRKDFGFVASVIRARRDGYPETAYTGADDAGLAELEGTALELCAVFANHNPAFNKARFLKACGVQS